MIQFVQMLGENFTKFHIKVQAYQARNGLCTLSHWKTFKVKPMCRKCLNYNGINAMELYIIWIV